LSIHVYYLWHINYIMTYNTNPYMAESDEETNTRFKTMVNTYFGIDADLLSGFLVKHDGIVGGGSVTMFVVNAINTSDEYNGNFDGDLDIYIPHTTDKNDKQTICDFHYNVLGGPNKWTINENNDEHEKYALMTSIVKVCCFYDMGRNIQLIYSRHSKQFLMSDFDLSCCMCSWDGYVIDIKYDQTLEMKAIVLAKNKNLPSRISKYEKRGFTFANKCHFLWDIPENIPENIPDPYIATTKINSDGTTTTTILSPIQNIYKCELGPFTVYEQTTNINFANGRETKTTTYNINFAGVVLYIGCVVYTACSFVILIKSKINIIIV